MTKKEYLDKIEATRNSKGHTTRATLDLIEHALQEYPHEPDLWCLRGDMIQLNDEPDEALPLASAMESYRRAIIEDPTCAEAYESLGYYIDVIDDDPKEAEPWFRKALELNPSVDSFVGLARVLTELGRKSEAMDLLSPANCPVYKNAKVQEVLAEIRKGC